MGARGWIKLHRRVQDHWIYQEDRTFSRYEAWLDLIMMANHKESKVLIDGELVSVEKGSFITSKRKLGTRWKWSNTKTDTFLKLLEQDEMIVQKSDTKKTVITIVKYEVYHELEKEKRHENETETKQKRNGNETETNKQELKELKNLRTKEFSSSSNDMEFSEVMQFYQANLQRGLTESPFNLELIQQFYDEVGSDLLLAAMKTSAKAEVKGIKFVEGVLKNWKEAGVKTVEDARRHEIEFKNNRRDGGNVVNIKGGESNDTRNYVDSVGDYGVQLYK